MITITLPEWLVYLFVVAAGLGVISTVLDIYLWWLKRRLEKLRGTRP